MKNIFKLFLITLLISSANSAYAHKVGNGGDYLRATYIAMGKSTLKYLNDTKEGNEILSKHGLSSSRLEDTLDINLIKVTEQTLIDNTGSVVDALGIVDLVTLNSSAWFEHFQNGRDVYYLVFHEMLRSAGVNDDNYIISKQLKNFPVSLRIETRIAPKLALITADRLTSIFNESAIGIGGSGCPVSDKDIITELNEDTNTYQISLKNYRVNAGAESLIAYKTCAVSIPVKVPASKRLVISLIDLSGELNLQQSSTSKLSFEAFLTGGQQKITEKNLGASVNQYNSFLLRKNDVLKSTCGGSDLMRINSNVLLKSTSSKNEYVSIKNIKIYLALEDCKK